MVVTSGRKALQVKEPLSTSCCLLINQAPHIDVASSRIAWKVMPSSVLSNREFNNWTFESAWLQRHYLLTPWKGRAGAKNKNAQGNPHMGFPGHLLSDQNGPVWRWRDCEHGAVHVSFVAGMHTYAGFLFKSKPHLLPFITLDTLNDFHVRRIPFDDLLLKITFITG